jgi:O-antigen/teichoic acid export membrane protein/GT2 family glycosyltransferase
LPCAPPTTHEPAVSLVVSTIGRPDDLRRLIESVVLEAASRPRLELIVIDQSGDGRIRDVLAECRLAFGVRYTTSSPGVSRGRNVGLRLARGAYVMFPDDDAWFAGDTLTRAITHLENHPGHDGYSVQLRAGGGRPSMLRWAPTARAVTLRNHHRTSIGSTMVFRTPAAQAVGGFDETMGPGAPGWYGSCEDADFLLRVVARGATIWYDPEATMFHRDNRGDSGPEAERKALSYGCGQGRLWRKHRFPRLLVASLLLRRLVGGALLLARGQVPVARVHLAWMRGAVNGLIGEPPLDLTGVSPAAAARPGLRLAPSDEATRTPRREFWRSFTWRLLVTPLGATATFALTAIAARRLDDRGMNLLYATLAALMIGPILIRFGLHQTAVRDVADARARTGQAPALDLARRHTRSSIRRSLVTAPVIAAVFIGGVDGGPGHLVQVALVAVVLAAESIRLTISDVLGGLQVPGWAAALAHQGRAAVVTLVVMAHLWMLGSGLGITRILAVTAVVGCVLVLVGLVRLGWWTRPVVPGSRLLPRLPGWRLGLPFLVVDLVAVMVARGDVLLAARALDPEKAALYSTASVLAAQAATPIGLASVALAPVVAGQMALGRLDEVERLVRTLASAVGAVMVLVTLGAAAFGDQLLTLAYGERFASAQPFLVTLMLGNLALAMLGTSGVTLTMAGRQRVAMTVSACWFAVAAPLTGLAALEGGPVALAAASAASTVGLYLLLAAAVWVTTGIVILPTWGPPRRPAGPVASALSRSGSAPQAGR